MTFPGTIRPWWQRLSLNELTPQERQLHLAEMVRRFGPDWAARIREPRDDLPVKAQRRGVPRLPGLE